MSGPVLLDLFCGAGGAARGYQRAGFYVIGVDIAPQPHYIGDEFHQRNAMDYLYGLSTLDRKFWPAVIHASPPCQAFTQMSAKYRGSGGKADSHPDFLTPVLSFLRGYSWFPWVVENVPGARRLMRPTLTLHGGMFGLGVHRPRLFESNTLLMSPGGPRTLLPIGVYGNKPDGRRLYSYRNSLKADGTYGSRSIIRAARSVAEAREAMGIDWMPEWSEIKEAIPPAYTEWIGSQLIASLRVSRMTQPEAHPEHRGRTL